MRKLWRRGRRKWLVGAPVAPIAVFLVLGFIPGLPHPFLSLWWIHPPPRAEPPDPLLPEVQRVLIVAPHPDDEVLALGGTIARLIREGHQVVVAFLTNGDANEAAKRLFTGNPLHRAVDYRALGYRRQKEAVRALSVLGLPQSHIIFLGYPDKGLSALTTKHWKSGNPYRSPYTKADRCFYRNSYRPDAMYCGEELVADLAGIVRRFSPTVVYLPHPEDGHADHRASVQFVLGALLAANGPLNPEVRLYLVHAPEWPSPRGLALGLALDPPSTLAHWRWTKKELPSDLVKLKLSAVRAYGSQRLTNGRFLASFVRPNEIYASLPSPSRPIGLPVPNM